MGVISGPQPMLVTTDHRTGTRVDRFTLSSTFNLQCYPAHNGRWIWITRLTTQTVTPFYLETKTLGSSINIGTNPVGIWDDGRFLWKISSAGSVGMMDLSTATVIESFSLTAGTYLGLTGDKRFLWTMDTTNVVQFDARTGTIIGAFTKPSNAVDLHHDGRFIWILTGAASIQGTIKQYDPSTGTQIESFNVTNYGLSDGPTGLCGDGRYLYNTELIL